MRGAGIQGSKRSTWLIGLRQLQSLGDTPLWELQLFWCSDILLREL